MVSPESQIAFLTNLQRLLAEGSFVATYKYALLLSLADISVEKGDDIGGELEIPTTWIAEKFIAYYWRQATPYVPKVPATESRILLQNTGSQAAIVKRIAETRMETGDSLACAASLSHAWRPLVQQVDQTVRQMPLWKLQTIGSETFDFLYPNVGNGRSITLRPGIATCFRRFYGLTADLVRGAWVRYVRRYNHDLLGTTSDLSEFMFGSERASLGAVRDALLDTSEAKCFYCDKGVAPGAIHVDHFIPWAKYPVDLGHNFVLAHGSCNTSKSDHIASVEYLEKWVERNLNLRDSLREAFAMRGILNDLPTSARVAQWVYSTTAVVGGKTWRNAEMIKLDDRWQPTINRLLETA
ncbi:MAG TPA: HNH endonuclease, partial [Planctomycetaceae bacterium]|nr:HNH endonuclease [Planctomycetaceae bacterium]